MMRNVILCGTLTATSLASFGKDADRLDTALSEAVPYLVEVSARNVRSSRFVMADGTVAYKPQATGGYEAFFLRDYAYILEGCASVVPHEELLAAAKLLVRGIDETGAGVDCVFSDGTFNYKPGGGRIGEHPVADGTVFTIDVAYLSWRESKSPEYLERAFLDRLLSAWKDGVPRNPQNGLVTIAPKEGPVDVSTRLDRAPYGFTDIVRKQGDVLFESLLDYEASLRLAEMLDASARPEDATLCRRQAARTREAVNRVFWNETTGLYDAATVTCRQADVWGSAFAVWLGVADDARTMTIAGAFRRDYDGLVQNGQVRHLLPGEYWELAEARKDTYQNGGYWGTPSGWFVYALAKVDRDLAARMVVDLVTYYRTKGIPEWCISGKGHGYNHLAGYLSSSTLPLAVFRKMRDNPQPPTPNPQPSTRASLPIFGEKTHFEGGDPRMPGAAEKRFGARPFKVMFIGAHPDDADFQAGALAHKIVRAGGKAVFVSCCNGDKGHQWMSSADLAARRLKETQASAKVLGVEKYLVLGYPDCEIEPTLELRSRITRLVRQEAPNLLITHRTSDYHADHRAVGVAVRDATYLLGVPLYCPDVPVPDVLPFVMYGGDSFREPAPFRADLIVADDDVLDTLLSAWACHASQEFEWLPPEEGQDPRCIPADIESRKAFLRDHMMPGRPVANGNRHRQEIDRAWGGRGPRYVEVFELCDYARPPAPKEIGYLRSLGFKWLGK